MASFSDTLPSVPFGSRILRLTRPFLRGTDVKVLQRLYDTMLELMNPPQGPMGSRIAIDGIFAPETAQAVANIQSYFGVPVDGVAGPVTYALCGQVADAFGGPAFGSRPLASGTQGGDVLVLQNRLNCLRYARLLAGYQPGLFDAPTLAAVQAFEADNVVFRHWLIRFDGVVDAGVFDILWITAFTGGRELREGVNGFDTAGLQVILQNLGFYPGAIDGYFGSLTRRALSAFQRTAGLPDHGVAGPDTYHALGLSNPVFWYSPVLRPRARLDTLPVIREVSSTIDPSTGDRNPYGIFLAPNTFDDAATVLKHGDLVVSNINNHLDVMGQGRSLVRIVNGQPVTFFIGAGAPIALAASNLGVTWAADFGSAPDGSHGRVQVISPDGALFSGGNIERPLFAGPWGMQFNFGPLYGLPPAFFSTNVLTGTIDRFTAFHVPDFNGTSVVEQIGSGFAHTGTTISTVFGPQGMIWLPMGDVLYIADGADDSIRALAPATSAPGDLGNGFLLYQGRPLHQPAGLGFHPENGHLIAVNQGDNRAIEIDPRTGQLVSARVLDPTPVNPITGAGSALFGLTVALDATGEPVIFYTDDNTNTVNVLTR
ncbi:MAG: peptidoglycan-binding protein [Firmicutes bacterium]|nr:peptidoglycan-binding protein [Bacillota bacterium]